MGVGISAAALKDRVAAQLEALGGGKFVEAVARALEVELASAAVSGAGGTGLGTVTSVASGSGLSGGPITGVGTLAVDGTVVRTGGSYADPAWITALAGSKITGALPAISGAAVTSLDAANVASGALADARLSSNIPLKNAANSLTGVNTVQRNALGYNWSQPTADLILENSTPATGSMGSQSSPSLVLHGRQWDSIGAGASKQTGVALYVEAGWAVGNSAPLHVAGQNVVTGAWTDLFVFPSWNTYWGAQEGVSWYGFRHKGINNFELGLYLQKLDGYNAHAAITRETGTEALQVRSCAAGAAVKIQDSAGAATQVDGANLMSWATVTGTSQAIASRVGYIANNAGLVTLSLPAAAAVGERIAVTGLGAGGWKISQAAGQTIHDGAGGTTTGVAGHVDSASRWDAITLQCVIANLDWVVVGRGGAPTFA